MLMMKVLTMTDKKLILILKTCIATGILLILMGIYLHSYNDTIETLGVRGIMISAACVAFGMALSLPTKMYLTFLLVTREAEHHD